MVASLVDERAFGLYPRHQGRVPHISLVFRKMWDTTALALEPSAGPTTLALKTFRGSHNSTGVPHVRTIVARISYCATFTTTTHAAFS
jgi:hypothetical protein